MSGTRQYGRKGHNNNNNNIAIWSGITNAVLQVTGPL